MKRKGVKGQTSPNSGKEKAEFVQTKAAPNNNGTHQT